MSRNKNSIESKLWESANNLRANSSLRSADYSVPVMGLIFLKWAEHVFKQAENKIEGKMRKKKSRRKIGKVDYQAIGAPYLPEEAQYSHLMKLPEGGDIGDAINNAMRLIESENEDLRSVLPVTYHRFESFVLYSLLRVFNEIPMDVEGDVFGKVYEYFLGKFEMTEGQKGGEFFTPTPLVKLIVDVLEPFEGRIFDPACGSGGMFVQSARFVKEHKEKGKISLYGQEKTGLIVRLCKMNLGMRGLAGDIIEANTYYTDAHNSVGKFDFVLSNPPFNVSGVDKERVEDDSRFSLGIPRTNNANYLWIQLFLSALNENGRAGFVMANSAADARDSEMQIRKKIIESGYVDVMISVGPKFFYTVGLPCMLWFFDKGKRNTDRRDSILFIDARHVFRQIDRAHRDFTPAQVEYLANIVRLYRGEDIETQYLKPTEPLTSDERIPTWKTGFPDGKYQDVEGLCKVATIKEIESNGWSLNPGRYVGIVQSDEDDVDFLIKFSELRDEFEVLTEEAHELEKKVKGNAEFLMNKLDNSEESS